MRRPRTLFSVAERLRDGVSVDIALPEFLDEFFTETSIDEKIAMLADEPPMTGEKRFDALLGATAEYLAKQSRLPSIPSWAGRPERILEEPWFTIRDCSDGMREYLSWASPAEFSHHNIFTDTTPFLRASRKAKERKPTPVKPTM